MTDALLHQLQLRRRQAFAAGILSLAACGVGAFFDLKRALIAYLFGYLFWLGLTLGSMGILMIHHLTGGRWGYVIRRLLEAAMRTLPLMALLFIPIYLGAHELYPWARPEAVDSERLLAHKHVYLNFPLVGIRALFFFAVWLIMAFFLGKWSAEQDRYTNPAPTRWLRALSGPGICIYPITATFAYIDWLMSLEPRFYSTVFLVIVLIGQILASFAFVILLLAWFKNHEPLNAIVTLQHFHQLGNLLLTFVMFWTYVEISQLIIVFSGNLPDEIVWYLHRIAGGWRWVLGFLALFHFFLPFFLLLFRVNKKKPHYLAALAGMLFVAHIIGVYWLVMPSYFHAGIELSWMDFFAPVGVGGLWLALFFSQLPKRRLIPQNDPRIEYAVPEPQQT